jgi:predicted nucleic acid-binding protein
VALFYADASALVKLVLDEPESSVLRTYLGGADVISCELVLSEVPRAIRRAGATDPALPRERLLAAQPIRRCRASACSPAQASCSTQSACSRSTVSF